MRAAVRKAGEVSKQAMRRGRRGRSCTGRLLTVARSALTARQRSQPADACCEAVAGGNNGAGAFYWLPTEASALARRARSFFLAS